jgi:hypothetical protein
MIISCEVNELFNNEIINIGQKENPIEDQVGLERNEISADGIVDQYKVKIIKNEGSHYLVDKLRNIWRSTNIIYFNNGLFGVHYSDWNSEDKAQKASNAHYSGVVQFQYEYVKRTAKFAYDKVFFMVDENSTKTPVELWVQQNHPFDHLPKIVSIDVLTHVKAHRMDQVVWKEYFVKLSDGVTLQTSFLNDNWKIGTTVLKIEYIKEAYLINIDAVKSQEYWVVNSENCILIYTP